MALQMHCWSFNLPKNLDTLPYPTSATLLRRSHLFLSRAHITSPHIYINYYRSFFNFCISYKPQISSATQLTVCPPTSKLNNIKYICVKIVPCPRHIHTYSSRDCFTPSNYHCGRAFTYLCKFESLLARLFRCPAVKQM